MARFEDNFWGEKHNGYDALYQNMKYGEQSSKDWMDFLRQYAACEEQYCKSLQRLAKSAGAYVVVGSFASVWPVVKASFEKLAQAHQDMSKQWQEMGKDIVKYADGQVKKHKAVKDSQTSTVEVVQTMQHLTVALQKSKEAYQSKFAEYCKARKEHASVKKADKMDADFKKAAEEYRTAVAKYNAARDEFQSKMTDSCKAFQEQEEAHLTQMLTFLKTFAGSHEQKHVEIGEMYYEFHSNVEQLSVPKLLHEFVDAKRTGIDRPPAAEFEEVDMSLLPKLAAAQLPEDADGKRDDSAGGQGGGSTASATMHIIIPGILKKRRGKKQQQQGGSATSSAQQRSSANGEPKDGDSLDTQSKNSLPEVDDDGYIIRKDDTPKEDDSWDSDTDSGSDGERSRTKIKVEIKPIDHGSSSGAAGSGEYRLPPRLSSTQLASAGSATSGSSSGGGTGQAAHDRLGSRSRLADGGGSAGTGGSGSLGTGSESSSSASAWDLLGLELQLGSASTSLPVTPESERLSAASLSGGGSATIAAPAFAAAAAPPGSADSSSTTEDREVERLWQSPHERRSAAAVAHEQASAAVIPGLPRPPSRRDITGTLSSRQAAAPPGRASPLRGGSADFLGGSGSNSAGGSGGPAAAPLPPFSSSRGPSPMCAVGGSTESMPIAVALTEVVDAYLKTSAAAAAMSTTRTTGDIMISLPAAVVARLLAESSGSGGGGSAPQLIFKLANVGKLEQWQVNERLVAPSPLQRDDGCATYAFSMAALIEHLRAKMAENRAAPYFNVDVAKYTLRSSSGDADALLPLRARAFWRCEATRIDFLLEYAYNAAGFTKPLPLGNVSFLVPVDGNVTGMQAVPEGQWSHEHRKALWKLDELQQSGPSSAGTVRARFELADGATAAAAAAVAAAAPVAVQFACEGTTVSGVDFELVGSSFRLSFTKRRMCTGKYVVDGDVRQAAEIRYV